MKRDTYDSLLGSSFNNAEEWDELHTLNEIRDFGKFEDLLGEKLLDRIWILQGGRPGFRSNSGLKRTKKTK